MGNIVWAKNNGNWSDTTLWAFWNETTQQIEDYGQIPQNGDDVYCNGYTITLNDTTLNIGNGTIRNDSNPYTTRSGGQMSNPASYNNISLTANFYCEGATIFSKGSGTSGRYVTLNGNIYGNAVNINIISWGGYETYLTINGNVTIDNGFLVNRAGLQGYVIINGNVTLSGTSAISNTIGASCAITINGTVLCQDNAYLSVAKPANANSTIYIYGGLAYTTSATYRYQTMVYVDNYLHYTNLSLPLNNITFLSNTIDFRYVGPEPNPNPYIIVNPNTIAQTYPTEDKVLAPTQYGAQMELVGQYTPDYPPESVVLKDFEYGDSDDRKTGTLETTNLSQQLISRLENCATVETVQQLLVAHLDN